MWDRVHYVLILVGAMTMGAVICLPIGYLYGELSHEARTKGKRIEFAAMLAGLVAAIVAAGSLAYTVMQIDARTDRFSALEKAAGKVSTQSPASPDRL